jgi:hypothetical protein
MSVLVDTSVWIRFLSNRAPYALGSLWQVSVGIPQGWVATTVTASILVYASTPGVRRAYIER